MFQEQKHRMEAALRQAELLGLQQKFLNKVFPQCQLPVSIFTSAWPLKEVA